VAALDNRLEYHFIKGDFYSLCYFSPRSKVIFRHNLYKYSTIIKTVINVKNPSRGAVVHQQNTAFMGIGAIAINSLKLPPLMSDTLIIVIHNFVIGTVRIYIRTHMSYTLTADNKLSMWNAL
jgi:hypothetical protein